jgi:hypothetical protein
VDIIQRAYAPSEKGEIDGKWTDIAVFWADGLSDILKAARVVFSFEHNDKLGKGAYSLDGMMIDAPVYKQVSRHVTISASLLG